MKYSCIIVVAKKNGVERRLRFTVDTGNAKWHTKKEVFDNGKYGKLVRFAVVLDNPVLSARVKLRFVPDGNDLRGLAAYSMLTHDGRRMVSYLKGTNTVYELVPTNRLPAGLPPIREWKLYGLKATHTAGGCRGQEGLFGPVFRQRYVVSVESWRRTHCAMRNART